MIMLGMNQSEKRAAIHEYMVQHEIKKVVLLSPKKFMIDCGIDGVDTIEWADIIEYGPFYRLLQEINSQTLVIINECLRTQNRYDLTYNCIRHYLNQTDHRLIFQWLPLIDTIEDFMILFDFDTRSRWKRERFDESLLTECQLRVKRQQPRLTAVPCQTDAVLQRTYQVEKKKLIDGIGNKDPHTIPRNLYLMSGKARMQHVDPFRSRWLIGRNNRFKVETLQTYKEDAYTNTPYTVFEFSHNFIDFADFLALSQQKELSVLVADLKVDRWYFTRYQEWAKRIETGYASLSQGPDRT